MAELDFPADVEKLKEEDERVTDELTFVPEVEEPREVEGAVDDEVDFIEDFVVVPDEETETEALEVLLAEAVEALEEKVAVLELLTEEIAAVCKVDGE